MQGYGVDNDLGAAMFFSFVFLGIVIAFYLTFIKKYGKADKDKR